MSSVGFIKDRAEKSQPLPLIVPANFTHAAAIGETGSGKTATFIYPNLKERIQMGHALLVYDYKGKEHLSVKHLAKNAGRLEDVVEINKPWGTKINLLKFMSFQEIGDFLKDAQGDMKADKYWNNYASNIGLSIIKTTTSYEEYEKVAKPIHSSLYQSIFKIALKDAGFYGKTLKSIYESSSSLTSLLFFIESMMKLREKAQRYLYELSRKSKKSSSEIHKLISATMKLEQVLKESEKMLGKFDAIDDMDTGDHVSKMALNYIQCIMSYANIGSNPMLNSDESDIPSLLEKGKIVILNTQRLEKSTLSYLTRSTLDELVKRVGRKSITPISVFIDEAQKIVSAGDTLNSDVLREAKVELLLSFQNPSLMIEALGGMSAFQALMGNMVSKYYFKANSYIEELDPLQSMSYELSVGEYIDTKDQKKKLGEHIEFQHTDLIETEALYQEILDVQGLFFKEKIGNHIVVHDQKLYESGYVVMEDVCSGDRKEVRIESIGSSKERSSYLRELERKFDDIDSEEIEF